MARGGVTPNDEGQSTVIAPSVPGKSRPNDLKPADFVGVSKQCFNISACFRSTNTTRIQAFCGLQPSSAVRMQAAVVWRASGSVMGAWLANACYSLGNIFSGKPSRDQSQSELIVANSAWATITFCIVILIARVPSMLSLRFLNSPDRPPTVWFCLKKLMSGSAFYFLVMLTLMIALGSLIAYLSAIEPVTKKFKLECYVGILCTHGFFTGITVAAKRIYYQETRQGCDRLLQMQQSHRSAISMSHAAVNITPASLTFWRTYIREFPKSAPAAVAGIFVHALSHQSITDRGSTVLACFVIASILLKLAIQEATKHYIIKKRTRNIRFMCAAVAFPTVLIDTQTRIILLRTMNTASVVLGTLGVALIEISVRIVKAKIIMRAIHSRKTKLSLRRKGHRKTTSPSPLHLEFELWRHRLEAYHIAEITADTYAEYIAIGCSASILYFYGDHPHYGMLKLPNDGDNRNQLSSYLKSLAFQVGIEVVVDFISTVLEMMAGIRFDPIKDLGAFLTFMLVVVAVLNINISVGIYLD